MEKEEKTKDLTIVNNNEYRLWLQHLFDEIDKLNLY